LNRALIVLHFFEYIPGAVGCGAIKEVKDTKNVIAPADPALLGQIQRSFGVLHPAIR
jgi:hypothetical protein